MLNVTVICIGKLKEQYLREASGEYIKRLSASCKLTVVELPQQKLSENPSQKEIDNALKLEGEKIREKLPKGAYIYTMCIEGKERTSEQFSEELDSLSVKGISSVVFIIGGSFGLSEEIKSLGNVKFSMSKMTFPHRIARIMLLEQLYRAFQISLGTRYHK